MAKKYNQPPERKIDPKKKYRAIFHTARGDMKVHLKFSASPHGDAKVMSLKSRLVRSEDEKDEKDRRGVAVTFH